MSPFNLEDYEPVEERLAKFWADHPMGRVDTRLLEGHEGDPDYIVVASIWRGFEVKSERPGEVPPPGATGLAQEVPGSNPVNRTSALENCETSAIGRALANLGYAPKGKRPSREEMQKASSLEPRTVTPAQKDPESAGPAGMGEKDDVGGEALGEGGPPPASPKDDLQFHPNSPHRMAEAAEFPGYLMCTKGKCPYWEYVGKGDA